jgi:hypothetical protein
LALLAVTVRLDDEVFALTQSGGVREQYRQAASQLQEKLHKLAQEYLGFNGGLSVSDAGPNLVTHGAWRGGELLVENSEGLEVHVALLGEFSLARLVGMKNFCGKDLEHLTPPFRLGYIEVQPTLTIRICRERDALRSLLFGEAPSKLRGETAVAGAFRFPPWHLASLDQWSQHLMATKGLPLFRFWGDWKSRYIGRRHEKSELTGFINASHRRPRHNSRQNLKRGNDCRHR